MALNAINKLNSIKYANDDMKKEFYNKYETVIIVNPKIKYIGDIKERILKIIIIC